MRNFRALGLLISVFLLTALSANAGVPKGAERTASAFQQVVESVDIQGNRRLRDEDLLYYIKTRPGDQYDPAALERMRAAAATVGSRSGTEGVIALIDESLAR